MKKIARIWATFFGLGFFPLAPGTLASLVVVALYALLLAKLAWPWYLLIILAVFLTGSMAATGYARELGQKDPGRIVVDEACGQLVVLFLMGTTWKPLLLAFLSFRIFDIIKPYPIRKLEGLPRGWGIMVDDVGAGIYSIVVARLLLLWIG